MYVHFNVKTNDTALITLRNMEGDIIGEDPELFPNTDLLVIQNDGVYSIELPHVFQKHRDLISKFKKNIWLIPHEAHPKLIDKKLYREASTLPVFETLHTFKQNFPNLDIKYFDNDIDTELDFKRWLRFNRFHNTPFEAKFWGGNKWALTLVGPLADYFNTTPENFLLSVMPTIINNRSNSKLFWCFNFKRRWGKVLAVYLLYKNHLLNDGEVTLYSEFVNERFVKKMHQYGLTIQDLDQFNKILPIKPALVVENNILTPAYFKSQIEEILDYPINLATETHYFESNRSFTEKTIKPLIFGQVILPIACYGSLHAMTELFGLKFSRSTYAVDGIKDPIARAQCAINFLTQFKNSKEQLTDELLEVKENYIDNMNIILDQRRNNEWNFIKDTFNTWI